MKAQTFTWAIVPEGKRVKKIIPLDERLLPYHGLFIRKFGLDPKVVFMRPEMAKDWEEATVLGMEIILLNRGYPIHHYSLAVTKKDFTGAKDDGPHATNRDST